MIRNADYQKVHETRKYLEIEFGDMATFTSYVCVPFGKQ